MYALAMQMGDQFPAISLPAPDGRDPPPLAPPRDRGHQPLRFCETALSRQTLSRLLSAASRAQTPQGRDASYSQAQLIDVYVALEQGLYLYDPERSRLAPVLKGDLRPLVAAPALPRSGDRAPVRLVYVADADRLTSAPLAAVMPQEMQAAACWIDGGVVAAHVFQRAIALGLVAWAHDCDRAALAKRLPLRAGRRVLFGQTVGYPEVRP